MPISLEPDKRFSVVLDCDAAKPKESRPTFFVLSQTMRGHKEILDVIDCRYQEEITVDEIFELTCKKLSEVIVGWSNMGDHVFGQSDLRDLLTFNEATELLRKVGRNSHVEPEEKKSSE